MSAPRRPDKPGGRPSAPSSRPRAGGKPTRAGKTGDGDSGERKTRSVRAGAEREDKPAKTPRVRKDGSIASGRTADRHARTEGRSAAPRDDRPARPARAGARRDEGSRPSGNPRARPDDRTPRGRSEDRPARTEGRPAYPREDRPARPARPARPGARRDEGSRPTGNPRARPDDRAPRGRFEDRPARTEGRPAFPRDDRPARPARPDDRAPRGRSEDRPARTEGRPAYPRDDRPARPARPGRGPAPHRDARPSRPAAPAPRREDTAKPAKAARVRQDGSVAVRVAPEEQHGQREPQRIAKLLARAGIASRREIERMIEEGRIAINGTVLDTAATILTTLAGVTVDGRPVAAPAATRLFLFHKPAGVLTAERDFSGRPTIYDRLPEDMPRVVPIGRLDLNTEGLLLLTNDGEFKRKLELPSSAVPRIYRVRAYGNISQEELEGLMEGIEIDGVRYGPIDANMERRTGANLWIEMKLTEGKNREVRRVLEHLGLQVSRLIRVAYGPFLLADLPTGEVGEVKQHELVEFRKGMK